MLLLSDTFPQSIILYVFRRSIYPYIYIYILYLSIFIYLRGIIMYTLLSHFSLCLGMDVLSRQLTLFIPVYALQARNTQSTSTSQIQRKQLSM